MRTKSQKKKVQSNWSWWEFEDEKPDRSSGYCDWCSVYVGNRKGVGMFTNYTVQYKGLKESGRACSKECKELLEHKMLQHLIQIDESFPNSR